MVFVFHCGYNKESATFWIEPEGCWSHKTQMILIAGVILGSWKDHIDLSLFQLSGAFPALLGWIQNRQFSTLLLELNHHSHIFPATSPADLEWALFTRSSINSSCRGMSYCPNILEWLLWVWFLPFCGFYPLIIFISVLRFSELCLMA